MSFASMSSSPAMSPSNFMRNVLRMDALSCVACGLLQVIFTSQMASHLNLPQSLVAYTGEFLLVYAAAVAFVSTRRPIPRAVVWVLVAGNLGWAASCLLLLASGQVAPSALGTAYVVMQALTVALLAGLQLFGLRSAAERRDW